MLEVKRDISQENSKQLTSILSNRNNVHSLEVVNRVSETQPRVNEKSNVAKFNGARINNGISSNHDNYAPFTFFV